LEEVRKKSNGRKWQRGKSKVARREGQARNSHLDRREVSCLPEQRCTREKNSKTRKKKGVKKESGKKVKRGTSYPKLGSKWRWGGRARNSKTKKRAMWGLSRN